MAVKEEDLELGKEISDLRDDEMSWADIAAKLDIGQGKAMMLHMIHTEPKSIKWKTEEQLSKAIVKARDDELLSWGLISARTDPFVPHGRCRKIWEEATGNDSRGNRIGKGGRFPGDQEPADKAEKTPRTRGGSRAARTKDAEEAKAADPGKKPLADYTIAEFKAKLNGKTIEVYRGEGQRNEKIKVKTVKKADDGELTLTDVDGKSRTVLAVNIKKIAATRGG